jgi:manganese transport protein
LALLINAGLLVLSACVFGGRGHPITDLREAYRLLAPIVGTQAAAVLFAVGLLCSGQSATISGTLAGQIVMEGFLQLRISPLLRRAITRGLAIVPALLILAWLGDDAVMPLLIATQVVLCLQLPFAVVPLIRFTNARALMGDHQSRASLRVLALLCAALLTVANGVLVARTVADLRALHPGLSLLLAAISGIAAALLFAIAVVPLRDERSPGAVGLVGSTNDANG